MAISYFNTVPNNNSTFITDLRTFLQQEDADRYDELNASGIIIQNGLITPGAGLTGDPGSLIAYAGGYRITETGTITFTNNTANIWVVAHKDTSGLPATPGNFTRVAGTHYLIDETTGASQPSLPEDCTWLMDVTTASGSITTVNDLRVTGQGTSDIITTQGDLIIGNAAGTPVRLAVGSTGGILLVGSGTLAYLAIGTAGQVLRSNGTTLAYVDGLTTKGDLWTYSTVPARLAVGGTDGMLLVVDSSAATGMKWDNGLTTQGDILYRDATGYQRLAIGTAGQAYKVNSGETAGEWGTLPLGGGGTNATSFTASQIIAANVGATALVSTGMTAPAGATGNVVTESNTQTLTNKTLTTPALTSPVITTAFTATSLVKTTDLKTSTGSSTVVQTAAGGIGTTNTANVTMNDYSFFPSLTVADTSSNASPGGFSDYGATGAQGSAIGSTDPANTTGRVRIFARDDLNLTVTTTIRWRYVTASDTPEMWLAIDVAGIPLATWSSDDRLSNTEVGVVCPNCTSVRITPADLSHLPIPADRIQAAEDYITRLKLKEENLLFRALQHWVGMQNVAIWLAKAVRVNGSRLEPVPGRNIDPAILLSVPTPAVINPTRIRRNL